MINCRSHTRGSSVSDNARNSEVAVKASEMVCPHNEGTSTNAPDSMLDIRPVICLILQAVEFVSCG
jgi:hypothetical protein